MFINLCTCLYDFVHYIDSIYGTAAFDTLTFT